MLFICAPQLSGIGQHAKKYMNLFPGSEYMLIDQVNENMSHHDHVFVFAIPVQYWLDKIAIILQKCARVTCMTVCETEPVHKNYGLLFALFPSIAVPSEFCKAIFSKQFPGTIFNVIHAHIPLPKKIPLLKHEKYTFYTIGNIIDPRKNVTKIVEAFVRLNEPGTRLVLKATCHSHVRINIPHVEVINGLLSEDDINKIHARCDCFVSFSKSEGVGLGAVEAAVRDKPVIITEFGGATEYIKTPYVIACAPETLTFDDFLFQKGMRWGNPSIAQLIAYMRDAYEKKLTHMDHSYTRDITSHDRVLKAFQY